MKTAIDHRPPAVDLSDCSAAAGARTDVCRYCGCTPERACLPPCDWYDGERTICTAAPCVERHMVFQGAVSAELRGTLCRCGARKQEQKPFCARCFRQVPAAERQGLYLSFRSGYLDTYARAVVGLVDGRRPTVDGRKGRA